MAYRQAKAAVYLFPDDVPFIVTESPSEIVSLMGVAEGLGDPLVKLTLGNQSEWNGKPLFVRADRIVAISPPKDGDENEN